MLNTEREMAYLREAVPILQHYLLSPDPAWQLPGIAGDAGQTLSMLTIGPLLFMLKRAKARGLSGDDLTELGGYEEQIFQIKIHNETIWKKKAGQDMTNRMRLWQKYLDEYRSDPRATAASYSNFIAQRVMLKLLWDELEVSGLLAAPLEFMLQSMDASLRLIFASGEFIWEPQLKTGFPSESFWYLYGKLK